MKGLCVSRGGIKVHSKEQPALRKQPDSGSKRWSNVVGDDYKFGHSVPSWLNQSVPCFGHSYLECPGDLFVDLFWSVSMAPKEKLTRVAPLHPTGGALQILICSSLPFFSSNGGAMAEALSCFYILLVIVHSQMVLRSHAILCQSRSGLCNIKKQPLQCRRRRRRR